MYGASQGAVHVFGDVMLDYTLNICFLIYTYRYVSR